MNGGGGGGGGGSPEPAYSEAKTSVWWDIENCMVPRGTDPNLIAQNMSTALARAGYTGPISITAYGDTGLLSPAIQYALSSTGINLHHVPAGIKDASDKKILVDMLFWAIDNPPPANYLLISGDRDFCNALHKLRMSRYNILLAHAPSVSQTLVAAAKSVWLWKSLATGDPPLKDNSYVSSVVKERLLRPPVDPVHPAPAQPLPPAPAPAPAPGPPKYVPKFNRGGGDKQVEPPQRTDEAGERSSRPDVSSVVKELDGEVARALETVQSAPPTLEGLKVSEGNSHHAKPYQPQTNMQPTMNNFNPSNSSNNSSMQQNNIPSAQNFGQPNNHNIPAQNFGQPNNHNIPSQNFGQPNNHNIPTQNFGQSNNHNIPSQNFGLPNHHNMHYGTNPNWPDGPPYPSGNFCTEPGFYPPNPNHPYPQYYDYNYRPVPPVPSQPVQTPRNTTGAGTVPNQPKPAQTPRSTTGTGTVPNRPKPAKTPRSTTGTGTVPNRPKPAKTPRSTTGTGTVPNRPKPAKIPRSTTGTGTVPNRPKPAKIPRSTTGTGTVPKQPKPAKTPRSTTGTGTVPKQPKPEVQSLISVVLRALSILKKEKIASNEANIENSVRFGEINMPTLNAKWALEAAVEQNVPKNEGSWNCVNVMDLDVKISGKTLNELIRFLSSSERRDELMAPQCSYHAAVILKKSSLKIRTLGDVLQILNNLISVKKWIVPNSSSGWQPLSLNLNGWDPNPNPNPNPNPDPAVKPNSDQPTSSTTTGWDD